MDGNECCTSSPIMRQKLTFIFILHASPFLDLQNVQQQKAGERFMKEVDAHLPEAAEIVKVCVYIGPSI